MKKNLLILKYPNKLGHLAKCYVSTGISKIVIFFLNQNYFLYFLIFICIATVWRAFNYWTLTIAMEIVEKLAW